MFKALTWHCCICCYPAYGRVNIDEWLSYKTQLHSLDCKECLLSILDQCPTKVSHSKINKKNPGKYSCFRLTRHPPPPKKPIENEKKILNILTFDFGYHFMATARGGA